ncbi:MAG: hypothetical protein OEU26_19790 [Candidatus Tectomicrobia bacterium]|nr:hypothetical protein [Candidatus Tectomicrobia bacterium]
MREVVEHETFAEVVRFRSMVVERGFHFLIFVGDRMLDEPVSDPNRGVT